MLQELTIEDYEQILNLWKRVPGMGLSSADSQENIAVFFNRNPGLSFAYFEDGKIVGTILTGHDGRRGYIYHLAVDEAYRRRGIGLKLVQASLEKLRESGIEKCHLFVFADNQLGQEFWKSTGWNRRDDLLLFSKSL
ncbi:MAG TPA: GNAT family N-acetyltransferase [Bacillota bacterium]|nr:GNAT family N-acetyltransferase [Bacillota bacterium]